jgi:hypothetical protein
VRIARSGAFACLAAVAVLGAGAAPAAAQDAGERPAVLLVLDASRSMNAPSGEGGSRLDAAKAAVDEVLDTVPAEAPMGLRVYGARVAGQGRAKACADTELVAPVAAGDRAPLRDAVHARRSAARCWPRPTTSAATGAGTRSSSSRTASTTARRRRPAPRRAASPGAAWS